MSKLLELEPQTALWKDPSTNSNAVWQVSPQYAVSSASATSSPLASSTKNQFSEDTAGFWILLATQTLEMLDASKHANAMAWLSFALGNLVVPHQVDNWSSLVTRHVLARAMYASIMGAVKALYALVQKKSTSSADTGDDGNDADKDKMAILVAVLALDQTVHLWPDPTLPQTKDSAAAAAASTATNTTASTTKGPSFVIQQAWLQARAALYAHAREHYNDTVLSSSFSQTDAWNDDLEACFGALQSRRRSGIQGILTTFRQHSTVYTIYDYSLPSRWTTIVLTTYGQVQTHLLPVLLALLQDEDWEVWKCVSTAAAAATQDSRPAAMTRKRKTTAAVAAVEPATALSGTVVRMALVSRLAKLLTTVTKNHVERGFSSNTPLRNYMDACWSPPSKKKKDGHTDPRDMCTMILYHLVDSHKNDCTPVDEQQPLINEAATPTMINSTFYPFVPDIIDQLAQFVISSLKLSYDEQSQVRQRLECVAAAYILQSGIPDVRCRSFAMLQLHSALLEGSHHASNGAMPVPVLPTRRRNKRAYAGVPIEDRLALFLRALPLAEYWQVLLEGLEQTYDTRRLDTEVLAGTTPGTSIAAAAAAPAKKKRGAKRRKTQPVEELPYRYVLIHARTVLL